MPKARPARKKTPIKTAISTPVKDAADDDDLNASLGKVSLEDNFKSYNFNTTDPTFFRKFTKKNVNYVEVDFFVGALITEDFINVEFVNDGMAIQYQKATPQMFGEVSRLKIEMGQRKFHPDDSRVVAHDDTVQDIRRNEKAVNKLFWGDKDTQIVALPEKCKGKIRKEWNNYSSGGIVNGNRQFFLILTCRMETEQQRSKKAKL
mmetsp:Transcript_14666/g.26497  ORF Transcript_14666/g.26497 Transcript_14666/m.26497 type:complete len:205 (-) Transcript_14666:205-819(-)